MSRLADPLLAERRRRQILDAAMLCFRRRGFHQATMQEICSEAGISPGALYRYFGSKSEIIAAIASDERDTGFCALHRAANELLVDFICRVSEDYLEKVLAEDHGALIAEIFAEAARDPILARSLLRLNEHRASDLAQHIAAAQAAGEIDPTLDPPTAAQVLYAALEGISLRFVLQHKKDLRIALSQIRSVAERYLGSARA
jgi:AcrR family transcriptional regulator